MHKKIEAVLNEHVRPLLLLHEGDMRVIDMVDGVVRFEFLGQCAGCPAADLTAEELVRGELLEHIPELTGAVLVHSVSDELLDQARDILKQRQRE